MSLSRTTEYLHGLVRELCKLPSETEWVEFKMNNDNPEEIGEYISALSNAAAFNGKTSGYLLWGVGNDTHEAVGTDVDPANTKKVVGQSSRTCGGRYLMRTQIPSISEQVAAWDNHNVPVCYRVRGLLDGYLIAERTRGNR